MSLAEMILFEKTMTVLRPGIVPRPCRMLRIARYGRGEIYLDGSSHPSLKIDGADDGATAITAIVDIPVHPPDPHVLPEHDRTGAWFTTTCLTILGTCEVVDNTDSPSADEDAALGSRVLVARDRSVADLGIIASVLTFHCH